MPITPAPPSGKALATAREAYARRDWPRAHAAFLAARDGGRLAPEDASAVSDAAWWLGMIDDCLTFAQEAYEAFLDGGNLQRAAVSALEVAYMWFLKGDEAQGSGWMSRGQRLLDDAGDCVERGFLLHMQAEGALGADLDAAISVARQLQDLGRRHADRAFVALGLVVEGRVLLRLGRVTEGTRLVDEAMLETASDELPPGHAGNICCHTIAAYYELGDLRRAAAATAATERWLATMPAAVLFSGICRVHRAQLLQAKGAWDEAEREAARAAAEVVHLQVATAAEGHYAVGDVRRLRGDVAGAEESYSRAHQLGRDPQPGLALLRLAQGRIDVAAASIRTALAAAAGAPLVRYRLCAAQVDIALAAGDLETARRACDELSETAATYASTGLATLARQACGAVLLAEGHPAEALPLLRDACSPGVSWTPPTRQPRSASCSLARTTPLATATPQPASATRRRRASGTSGSCRQARRDLTRHAPTRPAG